MLTRGCLSLSLLRTEVSSVPTVGATPGSGFLLSTSGAHGLKQEDALAGSDEEGNEVIT